MKIPLFCILLLIGLAIPLQLPRPAFAAAAALPPTLSPEAGPLDPQSHLKAILSRPIYQRWTLRQERDTLDESGALQGMRDWMDNIGKKLGEWLEAMFRSRKPPSAPTPGLATGLKTFFWTIAWAAMALFVVAIVVLIVRLVKSSRGSLASPAVLSREQVAAALQQGDALLLHGDQWLDEAGRLAAERNFRAMYRALYLGLLSGLHRRGKIDFNRNHTNWTYVSRYHGQAAEKQIFSQLTDLFDSVWYGLRGSGGHDLATLRRDIETLIGAGGAPAPASIAPLADLSGAGAGGAAQ